MTLRITSVCLLLAGCAPLGGVWSGSCDLEGASGPAFYDILEVDLDAGAARMQPDFWDEVIVGTVEADRKGSNVELVADMGDEIVGFTLFLDGVLAGDTIEGDCRTEVEEGNPLETGNGQLERMDSAAAGG